MHHAEKQEGVLPDVNADEGAVGDAASTASTIGASTSSPYSSMRDFISAGKMVREEDTK